jgi:Fe-S cluster assembly iron-binding protein IscA
MLKDKKYTYDQIKDELDDYFNDTIYDFDINIARREITFYVDDLMDVNTIEGLRVDYSNSLELDSINYLDGQLVITYRY